MVAGAKYQPAVDLASWMGCFFKTSATRLHCKAANQRQNGTDRLVTLVLRKTTRNMYQKQRRSSATVGAHQIVEEWAGVQHKAKN
jgi:hypothetical protein